MFGFHHSRHGCEDRAMHAMRGRRGGFSRGEFGVGEGFSESMRGGGRGGRRRVFDAAELKLVLLKLISDQPRHGYDLIRAIEDLTGGSYAPSPGIVYPTLTLLGDMGHISEQEAEGTKRSFAITDAGRAIVDDKAEMIEALFARLSALSSENDVIDGSPVRRAMMNLHAALRLRVSRGDRTAELAHEVAAILDDAVRRIEKL